MDMSVGRAKGRGLGVQLGRLACGREGGWSVGRMVGRLSSVAIEDIHSVARWEAVMDIHSVAVWENHYWGAKGCCGIEL